eukprot:XP_014769801.1 PREDICTED: zinc finger protein 664-like [Octopus bimaculoides]
MESEKKMVESELYEDRVKCESQSKMTDFTEEIPTNIGKRLHYCDICKKPFSQTGALNVHRRIHTGEKPFRCDICGKTFCQKSSLSVHERIHTGEKPYRCDICGKTFSQVGPLITHKPV